MFLGLDLGTSGVKALLVDGEERALASATVPLSVDRPRPGWSEQDPEAWWEATLAAVDALKAEHPAALAATEGIGLSGQMHGAVLLDAADRVLRPCILWNDGRSQAECGDLAQAFPDLHTVAGNLAMPGFTAPKLLWVRRHEPDVFAATRRVLLPKAWLRLRMTGEAIEEMSDASGTLWLDVGARAWSEAALAATDLGLESMPRLVEGTAPAGRLRPDLARRWGMARPPLMAGGAGDNAAGAIGLGAVRPGDGFVSLGTSGVLFAVTREFRPHCDRAVHTFCHALPGLWHQMGVTLSAGASLAWWSKVTGCDEAALVAEAKASLPGAGGVLFVPYLSGERTPHNDGALRGALANLAADTDRAALTRAVLEGVAYSIRDCLDALDASGTVVAEADVIGGGSRSPLWVDILAAVLDRPLHRIVSGDQGAAFGAARLGRLAVTNEDPGALARPARTTVMPDPSLRDIYAERIASYRNLSAAVSHRGDGAFRSR